MEMKKLSSYTTHSVACAKRSLCLRCRWRQAAWAHETLVATPTAGGVTHLHSTWFQGHQDGTSGKGNHQASGEGQECVPEQQYDEARMWRFRRERRFTPPRTLLMPHSTAVV